MTTKTQFAQALKASNEAGFPIVLNVMSCCTGCANDADLQKAYDKQAVEFDLPPLTFEEDAPNAVWHFGGQGNQIVFDGSGDPEVIEDDECTCYDEEDEYDEDDDGNEVLMREGRSVECDICRDGPKKVALDDFLLNHPSDEVAQSAVATLREAGFTIDWDGSQDECITVHC